MSHPRPNLLSRLSRYPPNSNPNPSPWLPLRIRSLYLSQRTRLISFSVFRTRLTRFRCGPRSFRRVRTSWAWVGDRSRPWVRAKWGRWGFARVRLRLWISRWPRRIRGVWKLWTSIWATGATRFTSEQDFSINRTFFRGNSIDRILRSNFTQIFIYLRVFWKHIWFASFLRILCLCVCVFFSRGD